MFAFTRDCRKILRLFKWLGEYEKLERLLSSPSSAKQQLAVLSTLGMAAYWFFDNLTYLVKGGLIADNPSYARLSMLGWNVGITGALIADAQLLMDNMERERALRAALGLPEVGLLDIDALREGRALITGQPQPQPLQQSVAVGVEGEEAARMRREIVSLYSARLNLLLSFIKNGGDWLISANGSGLIENVIGYSLNDGVMGIAGTVSGLAVMAQVWRGL